MKKFLLNLLLIFFFISSCAKEDADPEESIVESKHPFLIVKKDQFQSLREKSTLEPWKSMKEDALLRSKNGSKTQAYDLQYYVGAAALAYILDEKNAQIHANRVRDAIVNQYSKIKVEEGSDWSGVVPPMGSFFVAILSLDIVYNSLSTEEVEACEKAISDQIFKIKRTGSWADVRRGTHGVWDVYKGIRTTPDNDYFNGIMIQITEDGVSPVTNHYAWERVGGGDSRISKSGYMDVLEFTGIDNRYYNNERLIKFHRWLFGSSVNCSKEMAIFGDMLPTQGINNDMLHRRVVNFDHEAAEYAAWFHHEVKAKGNILTYILPKEALPEAVVPKSQIYQNGGAFFREQEDNTHGLHGVLYNIKSQDEWHTHNEVNGLALSGLGNRLLVNGGRLGEPTRAANLNNTLTINGKNHDSRLGGGIVDGFTTNTLDYACGFSGPALKNDKHYRSLILVHASEGANPYFVVFDEIETAPNSTIKNHLHPANQTSITTLELNVAYDATIDHYASVNGVTLKFFYATPSVDIKIEKVASAVPERYPGYPDHNRLESVYNVGTTGKKNIVTVLYPYNNNLSMAALQKFEGEDFSGGLIRHNEALIDYVIESTGETFINADGVSVQAKAAIWREISDQNNFYFVRQGKGFAMGTVGFESNLPVSLFVKGNEGVVTSSGAKIKLKGPEINSIVFDEGVQILGSGNDFVEVQLPKGIITFKK
jgi:hypothetical protein